ERDSYGRNILYWAIKNRSQHNIKLLLKYNVDLMVENDLHALFHTISSNDADTFILLLNSNMTNINMRNKESQTLLMKAIEVESIEMVRHLINHGADLFSVDDNGNSPIDYAKKCKNINVFELVHYRILFEKIQTKKSA
ncbi:MAG TPA: ankyrin repeat domain-containing protein, partial [Campylobacterales bacterium]|nr:ankyrin repeat domain-containing protein [Campylobacterales bacterium]